jgi:SSS family solute:Na+ symporter
MKTSTDYFLSGRSIPAWVAGLAFLSANLGAQEVIGMAASGAKYGMATSHFYWVGAIPAMVFLGVFMMPFYYGSQARSVPEYLKLRFDEKTRGLNAISFATMTVFSSGDRSGPGVVCPPGGARRGRSGRYAVAQHRVLVRSPWA